MLRGLRRLYDPGDGLVPPGRWWQTDRLTKNDRHCWVFAAGPPGQRLAGSGRATEYAVAMGLVHRFAESHVRVGPFAKKRAGVLT